MTDGVSTDEPDFVPLDPFRIQFNPDNPRGKHVEETDRHLWPLVESVREFGVLVPLIVMEHREGEYEYMLVDGERRLLAARKARLETVPARVVRPPFDTEALRKTMFHIHRYREAWTAPAECEALTPLYEELVDKYDDPDDPALLEEFIDRTGYYAGTAQDRLRFLHWPSDLKARVYEGDARYWFVVEVERIVDAARRNFPEYVNDDTVDVVRRKLFQKSVKNVVGPAVAVREAGIIARTPVGPADKDKALAILQDLVEQPTMTFEEARDQYLAAFPDVEVPPRRGPVAIANELDRLAEELREYDEQYILKGVGRSRINVAAFLAAVDELSEVLEDLTGRLRAAVGEEQG